jgi:class 3 adenylate cyclase
VLPPSISARLKSGSELIADGFDEASVLFGDIVGFTELSGRLPVEELAGLLNRVFSRFDDLAERHGLEKIKTIGDAYMVASGLPVPRADHAVVLADMALDMRDALAAVARDLTYPLQIRIGIHAGPVVAGVIGKRKFIYDLWGDTVNTASRMESHGVPGEIQISEAMKALLGGAFELESRGEIQVKGKGAMVTYLLKGRVRRASE